MRLIKIIFFAIASLLPASILSEEHPKFSDIEWFYSSEQVKTVMLKRGYELYEETLTPKRAPNGVGLIQNYKGEILERKVEIEIEYSLKQELRFISVQFHLGSDDAEEIWKKLLTALSDKYGKPHTAEKGVLHIANFWKLDPNLHSSAEKLFLLMHSIDDANVFISVGYSSPNYSKEWHSLNSEIEKRKSESNSRVKDF